MIYDHESTETFQYPGIKFQNTGEEKNSLNGSRSELHKLSKSCSQGRMTRGTYCFHMKLNCF